jgi:hypothetical protein
MDDDVFAFGGGDLLLPGGAVAGGSARRGEQEREDYVGGTEERGFHGRTM